MIIIIVVSPGFAQGFKQSNIYSVGTVSHIVPSAYEHRQFIKCIFIKTSYRSREAPPLLLYQLLKSSSIWPLSQHSLHKQSPQDRDGCADGSSTRLTAPSPLLHHSRTGSFGDCALNSAVGINPNSTRDKFPTLEMLIISASGHYFLLFAYWVLFQSVLNFNENMPGLVLTDVQCPQSAPNLSIMETKKQ